MIALAPTAALPRDPIERLLRGCAVFQGLRDGLVASLARGAITTRFLRGEAVWREGDDATRFVVIVSGLVKITRRTADDTESILALFGPREAAGAAAVVQRGRYPAAAIVVSERAEIVSVDAAPALAAMDTDPSAVRAMNAALLTRMRDLHGKINVMSAGSVPQRLATQLLQLAERFGDELEEGALCIPFSLTRGDLASLVGARVETTIRVLSAWQRAGCVAFEPDRVLVRQPDHLRAVARGET